jgi:hypothetical protein
MVVTKALMWSNAPIIIEKGQFLAFCPKKSNRKSNKSGINYRIKDQNDNVHENMNRKSL